MKRYIFVSIVLFAFGVKAQTSNWTKDDRNNLYSDCMSYATKYNTITVEQKESICLCYLEETTKKYVKSDFEAKIDIELKRIKDAGLTQCAKNIGVELSTQPKLEVVKEEVKEKSKELNKEFVTKSFLEGKWKSDDNSIFEFQKSGQFTLKYLTNRFSAGGGLIQDGKTGDYFLDGKGKLTMVYNWSEDVGNFTTKIRYFTQTCEYNFVSFSEGYFKMENLTIAEKAIQCNKVE